MIKKKLILFIFSILFLNLVSASYPQLHIGRVLNGFNEVNSPIVTQCTPYLNVILDGDNGADVGVTHYGSADSKMIGSYIYPHTRGGYQTCFRDAGADVQKQCFCYGIGLHIIEDITSHTEGGYTVECISKWLGSNYYSHMSCEQEMEKLTLSKWNKESSYAVSSGQLDYYNSIYLNSLFTETGGDTKYLQLLNSIAGIDVSNDARIVRSGYQGEGFYSTVYQDKLSLPWWAYAVSIGLIITGLCLTIFIIVFGRTNWKWVTAFLYFMLFIIGAVIVISFITGTSWKLVSFFTAIPPKIGMYSFSSTQVEYYDNLAQENINQFLKTGQLNYDDASGLSYVDRNGNMVDGALSDAELGFKIAWFGVVLPLYIALNIYLAYKSFSVKKKR